ncbi:MAG: asparagine synthetase B, partial [Planctomycetota bacterium]|nr:asparagine synthetase B [Planctomycetota bacterium]
MCGIAVIVAPPDGSIPQGAIERMTTALRHRGPDEQGWLRQPFCHLGHTRLSVIDPTGGKQPMADEAGRFCLVYNGEIYNYRELRDALRRDGQRFATSSDTEVLLRLCLAKGEAALELLSGQFAFALWDNQERRLLAGRDRFG